MADNYPTPVPAIATPETDAALMAAGIPWGQQTSQQLAENERISAEHRQQTTGYDMSHVSANATLINNNDLAELRRKARLLDWLTSQKRISIIHCVTGCLLLNEDIEKFEAPTVLQAINAAALGQKGDANAM